MTNQSVFYSLVSGFTLGIFMSSFIKMGFSFFLFLLLLSTVIFIWGKFLAKSNRSKIILLSLFLLSFGLGVLRYEIKDLRVADTTLSDQIGEKVILKGVITEEPSVKDQGVQLIVSTEAISTGSEEKKAVGKILVSTGLFPEFQYGDRIQAEGRLEEPENFSMTAGLDFDYIGYLAKEEVFYQISFAQVKLLSAGHGSAIKTGLFAFKKAFIQKINFLIKEPESALLNGLILGAKNSLGADWQADFRTAGVSHIVALSGYNITIVVVAIMAALSFLPKVFSVSFGVLGIILFTLMVGGGATVVRASMMALLVILAKQTNRRYDISRALVLAGVLMLVQNPKILVFDLSFQLSFLATVALIFVSPLVEKRLTFITTKFKLRELVVATIATQIFVLPFLIYKMGLISLFGLFANLFILPMVPWVMLFGFLAGSLGFLSLTLATPLAFLASLLLSYMLKVIYFFSHLPFSALAIKSFPVILTVIIYVIFLVIIWRAQNFSKIKINDR